MTRRELLKALFVFPIASCLPAVSARAEKGAPFPKPHPSYVWTINSIKCSDGLVIGNLPPEYAEAVCEDLNRENNYRNRQEFEEWYKGFKLSKA